MMDRQLDMLEVLLMRVSEEDKYKQQLIDEYNLYRSAFESVPRDRDIPDILQNAVNSFDQRLRKYIIQGTSNNPIEELVPTLTKRISKEEEKEEILKIVNSNISYLENRKSQHAVLKSYLENIDYKDISIEDFEATIFLAEEGYNKTNVRSNEMEQEIVKAKYYLCIRFIYEFQEEKASNLMQSFGTDMVLFIHKKHKSTVEELLKNKKSKLAMEISVFLTDFPKAKEKDIEFWKVLTAIEYPDYPKKPDILVDESNSSILNNEDNALTVKENIKKMKIVRPKFNIVSFFKSLFNKEKIEDLISGPKFIQNEFFTININDDGVEISVTLLKDFTIFKSDLERFESALQSSYKKYSEVFTNCIIMIYEQDDHPWGEFDKLGRVIRSISNWCAICKLELHGKDGHNYEIEEGKFSGIYIRSIEFHGGTWTINKYAFSKCIELEKVEFTFAELQRIDDGAFFGCRQLKNVLLPARVSNYFCFGEEVFANCENLEFVNLPSSFDRVKKGTFKNCKKIQKIGAINLVAVEDSAFEGCESLTEIFNSENIEEIGNKAFYGCKSLTKFKFGDCSIGDFAFAKTGLTSVELELRLHQVGDGIFEGSQVKTAIIKKSLVLTTAIFKDCKGLKSIDMGDVAVICKDAFNGCESLEGINISYLVSRIDERAFMNCKKIRFIELPKGCSTIGEDCFNGCISLGKINIPAISVIECRTFCGCKYLDEIVFEKPGEILEIKEAAFKLCERLAEFEMPPNVKSIGDYAFANTFISEIIIPEATKELGKGAFYNCTRLTNVTLSSYIRDIEDETFKNCYRLCQIDMSKCFIDIIGKRAFESCESLKKIVFADGLRKMYKDSFGKCCAVEEIVIPIGILGISSRDIDKVTEDYHYAYEFMDKIGLYDDYDIDEIIIEDGFITVSVHSEKNTSNITTLDSNVL